MVNNDVLIDLLRGKFSGKPELRFTQKNNNEDSAFFIDRVEMSYENRNKDWPLMSFDCENMVSVARATGCNFLIGYDAENCRVTVDFYTYGN